MVKETMKKKSNSCPKKKKKRRNQTKQERFYLKENAFRVFVLLWGMVKQSFREA